MWTGRLRPCAAAWHGASTRAQAVRLYSLWSAFVAHVTFCFDCLEAINLPHSGAHGLRIPTLQRHTTEPSTGRPQGTAKARHRCANRWKSLVQGTVGAAFFCYLERNGPRPLALYYQGAPANSDKLAAIAAGESIPNARAINSLPAVPTATDLTDNQIIAPDKLLMIDLKLKGTLLRLITSAGRRRFYMEAVGPSGIELGQASVRGLGSTGEIRDRRTTGSLEVIKVSLETELKTLLKYAEL